MIIKLKNFKSQLIHVMLKSEMVWTRFTLSLAEMIWAVALLWEGETFARKTYYNMSIVASENVWGVVFILTSITQFWIMLNRNYHSLFAIMFASYNMLLWWFVVLSMYSSVYPPPAGISGELALAFSATWIMIRSGTEVIEEGEKRNG